MLGKDQNSETKKESEGMATPPPPSTKKTKQPVVSDELRKAAEGVAPNVLSQLATLGLSPYDLFTTHNSGRGDFVLKALLPYEKNYVVKLIAEQAGNVSSLFMNEADHVRMICTLQVAIDSEPDWFEGPGTCLDEDLLAELFEKQQKLQTDVQAKLKKNRGR